MSSIANRMGVVAFGLFLALTTQGFAALIINGDINSTSDNTNYTGLAAAPDGATNTFWNNLTPDGLNIFTSAALTASDGSATSVTTTFTAPGASTWNVFTNGGATGTQALLRDLLHTAGANVGSFSFNNLTGTSYDVYLYSQNAGFSSASTKFTIGGVDQTAANPGAAFGDITLNKTYVKYGDVAPVGGVISGTFVDAAASQSAFDGFQLVQLPEPASVGMLALGGLVLMRRRNGVSPTVGH